MTINLFADINIFYEMILKWHIQIIQSKRFDVGFCSFENVFEDTVMFWSTVEYTYCLFCFYESVLKLNYIADSSHRYDFVDIFSTIQLNRFINKSTNKLWSQTVSNNIYKLIRKYLMNNISKHFTSLDRNLKSWYERIIFGKKFSKIFPSKYISDWRNKEFD